MERAQGRLKEMVETINNDPPNSLRIMHTKYGQPCDELLVKGTAKVFGPAARLRRLTLLMPTR